MSEHDVFCVIANWSVEAQDYDITYFHTGSCEACIEEQKAEPWPPGEASFDTLGEALDWARAQRA